MLRLAREREVLLVNSIGMRMPVPGRTGRFLHRVLRKIRSTLKFLRTPEPDLPRFHVLTPISLPVYGWPLLRALNFRFVALQVRAAMLWLRIRKPYIVITLPTAFDVAKRLPHRSLVYNRSDKHSLFSEANTAYIESLEKRLLRECDHVLYVSRALMEEERELTGERAVFLDHGVDLDLFRRVDPHPDIAGLPRPRVGFVGTLRSGVVDLELLERVAREIPEASVVVVGNADACPASFLELPNVHVLGPRPHAEIPALASGLDVALMPWMQNEWIRNCNPIKLKEHLALGLKTVSMPFAELEHYRDVVVVARDKDDFVSRVRAAIKEESDDESADRRKKVVQSSWDNKARLLASLCSGGNE